MYICFDSIHIHTLGIFYLSIYLSIYIYIYAYVWLPQCFMFSVVH